MRLNECKEQIKHIKKGIDISFDSKFLRLLSWKDLQYKVVGQEKIDIERLKKMTVYRVRILLIIKFRIAMNHTRLLRSSGRFYLLVRMKTRFFI